MCRFFESIKIKSGIPQNLTYHQDRLNKTIEANFKKYFDLFLDELIIVPKEYCKGIVKCRFEYDETGYNIKFENYQIKSIKTLKIVYSDDIDYAFKKSERSKIQSLLQEKSNCDDILIIRNGFVTDISFANSVFFDGKQWFTSDTPLLEGTCRRRLIDKKRIFTQKISISDLEKFTHFAIINAMRGEDLYDIQLISKIYT